MKLNESNQFPKSSKRILAKLTLGFLMATVPFRGTAQIAPAITKHPAGATRSLGDRVTFNVIASGSAPLRYQWSHQGVELAGAINSFLTLTNLTLSAAGEYRVTVANESSAVTGNPALLDVDDAFRVDDTGPTGFSGGAYAISMIDFDNDGALDISVGVLGQRVRLFHNEGGARFTETQNSRLTQPDRFVFGASWADYDNDGFQDVLLLRGFNPAGKAPCALLQNSFGKEFVVVTNSPVGSLPSEWEPGIWGDFNRDGWLDIYLGATAISSGSVPAQDALYLSDTQGQLRRQTQGITTNFYPLAEYSNGGTTTDLDNDGLLDLVILSSARKPRWLRNLGGGDFAIERPFAFTGEPDTGGSPVAGDFNDGGMDVLFATFQGVRLFVQQPDGSFLTPPAGALDLQKNTLAVACSDYDNDGWLDIFTAVYADGGEVANDGLWRNNGDGTFSRVTRGSLGADGARNTGAVWGDLDNNGFEDLYTTFDNLKSRLYLNQGNGNHWLTLKLAGTQSNRAALGAKVRVRARIGGQDRWQLRELAAGWGYALQGDARPHFGLGDATQADVLRIEWPSGIVQELHNVAANQILTVTEPAKLEPLVTQANGIVELKVKSWKGFAYDIEASNDLKAWSRLTTLTNETGTLSFADPAAGSAAQRFYRVVNR